MGESVIDRTPDGTGRAAGGSVRPGSGDPAGGGAERAGAARRRRARFHALTVAGVRPLTDRSVEVVLAVPDELRGEYDYLPGQNVALRAEIGGREVRRSYSLCRAPSSAGNDVIAVAIKRDEGGLFSVWANEQLTPGMRLDVMTPQGTFTTELAGLDGKHLAAVAAGSGITPVMALARTVLERSATARFSLVFANRAASDVMFLGELADLKDRFPARFALHHVLTREKRTVPVLSGRLDAGRLDVLLERVVRARGVDEWFLCGPLGLVRECQAALARAGVEAARVRFELFTTDAEAGPDGRGDLPADGGAEPGGRPGDAPAGRVDEPGGGAAAAARGAVREIAVECVVEVTLDGVSSTVEIAEDSGDVILDAALRARPDAPYSCANGVCGTCRARLVSGSVEMRENYALEPEEIAAGYVLTCQSRPTSDRVTVDYDV
ncbi:2Fe-2S iron-sulfur cluster-binding protein [Myceligenerans crystallogenes]|uniref:Phenylacetate-CoA oxygenase/reductase subunit PaaK n=1 Tax=Myceligenerans crystallogenes TaxID=316335 RepID=A0ABP4ZAL4_9MICO